MFSVRDAAGRPCRDGTTSAHNTATLLVTDANAPSFGGEVDPSNSSPCAALPVASCPPSGSCRLVDTKITRTVAWVALLIYAGGTDSALCDLCPGPLMDGALTIPHTAPLQFKANTQGGDATLTSSTGTISGQASVTCESGEFRAILYGMSDGSLYRCLGTIDGQRFTGHCVIGEVAGEISGRFLVQP